MFSVKEKQLIAQKIEEVLLSLKHPEMPEEKPRFALHVDGAKSWSWADITPNWEHSSDEPRNEWNETVRENPKGKELLDKMFPQETNR